MTGTIVAAAERALLTSIMAQVVDGGGSVVGAAFAVGPDLLVTAAHVLEDGAAALVPLGHGPTPFDLVDRMGDVDTVWDLAPWPDLAVMRIAGHRFACWARLAVDLPAVPAPARMVGFPLAAGASNLSILSATIDSEDGVDGTPVLRLVGTQVEGGASGGPLVDPVSRSVVGVVLATKDPDRAHGGFGVGLHILRQRWPTATGPWPPAAPDDAPWAAAYPEAAPAVHPPLFSELRANAPHFVERPAVVEKLAAATSTTVIRALGGSGGVGKSELALWWAWRCASGGDHDVVWWVDATSAATTLAGLSDLATALGTEPGDDLASTARAVGAALARRGRWLIVFDNADTLDHLVGCLPTAVGGLVLVTTRATTAASKIDAAEIDLDVFSEEEAVAYLFHAVPENLHGDDAADTAASIADRLGYLPLALAQAAAFMVERSTSLTGYEALIADDLDRGLEISASRHERTVATLWDHIWPLFGDTTRAVLARASLLAPKAIPVEALETDEDTTEAVAEALREAARYRVVTITPDVATIDMHQLTQLAARPTAEQHDAVRAAVVSRLDDLVASVDATHPGNWPFWARLDPHVAHLYTRGTSVEPVLLHVVDRLATYRQWRGFNHDAIPLFERVREDSGRILGPDHPETMRARVNLAASYWQAGRTNDAIIIEEAVLDYRQRILGPDHPDTIRARANLAASYLQAGRTNNAITLLETVLADYERIRSPDHPDTIRARANLAVSYYETGRTNDAITLQEAVLTNYERVLDPDHPDTIRARANLAASYWQAGRADDAIPIEEAVLADYERILDPDHPDTVLARANLAVSYYETGRTDDAITLQEAVLADRQYILDPDHPDTIRARANLATSYLKAGRTDDAITLQEAVLADRQRILDPDHPDTVLARANLAASYLKAGRTDDAISLQEAVLTDYERIRDPDHPDTIRARANLAISYRLAGRTSDGIDLLTRALADSREVIGADHPETVAMASVLVLWTAEGDDPPTRLMDRVRGWLGRRRDAR